MLRRNATPRALLVVCSLLIWQAVSPVYAQSRQLEFRRISRDQGLSQASGNVFLEDRQGYLWIGTQDGLNRYNGYEVEVFRRDSEDSESLADNFIISLHEDRDGKIWVVGAEAGKISVFDPVSQTFSRVVHRPDDPSSLIDDPISNRAFLEVGDSIWLGTRRRGLQIVNRASEAVERIEEAESCDVSLCATGVYQILRDGNDQIWLGTEQGVYLVESIEPFSTKRFIHPEPADRPNPQRVFTMVVAEGALWVASPSGMYQIDLESPGVELVADLGEEDEILFPIVEGPDGRLWVGSDRRVIRHERDGTWSHRGDGLNNVQEALVAADASLWIATAGEGLLRFSGDERTVTAYRHDPGKIESIPSDVVSSLYETRSGQLWIGTSDAGIASYSPSRHKFAAYGRGAGALVDDTVWAIQEDLEGGLWIGTMTGGLHRFALDRSQVVERYHQGADEARQLPIDYVQSLEADRHGSLWVGTAGAGLLRIEVSSGEIVERFEADQEDDTSLANDGIQMIHEDSKGQLWVSTGGALSRFDSESRNFVHFAIDNQEPEGLTAPPRMIAEDTLGMFWAPTGDGLARIDPGTGDIRIWRNDPRDLNSLAHDSVMSVHIDDEGLIWVVTYGGGLDRFDPRAETFRNFGRKQGMPSDNAYGVLPGSSGELWLSTNEGITRFDPRTEVFESYSVADGLQGAEFNDRSFHRSPSGELFFGGLEGFNAFYPEQIVASDFQPATVLTAFRKFGEPVSTAKALSATEEIVLSYKDDFFSFEFSTLDFSSPERNRYAYKLEGFDHDWIAAGTRRFASYTNLDGGNYVFRVKGTNGDGMWTGGESSIKLRVIPPPWKTWWAYSLYMLGLISAVLGYVQFKTRAHERELEHHRIEVERQRAVAERLQQVDAMKDEFLANTSHELRTPLNGIIGLTESLLDGATGPLSEATKSNLVMVASSGRRLAHLVDDILDFSKLKSREIELRLRSVELGPVVDEVLGISRTLIAGRSIELLCEISEELPPLRADSNRLQQILHNLIGNALKFTEEGSITLSARVIDADMVEIEVADTGIGIDPDRLASIFESFEQADASTSRRFGGTGLGLPISKRLIELQGGTISVESVEGEGSSFRFTLPRCTGQAMADEEGPAIARRSKERFEPLLDASMEAPVFTVLDSARGGRNARILVVDDEPVNLKVMENMLGLADYRVAVAHDGIECLRRLEDEDIGIPDLILLDVMMPRLSGYEVAEQIRQVHSATDLPIILVTAKNQVSDLVEGLAAGANDYISKPFSKNELLARIKTHLDLSRAHVLEADHHRRRVEMDQARSIQLSLLPKAPPQLEGYQIAAFLENATEVGGDYYDFFPQPDGSFYAVCGDATGHGISAGMMVSMTKSALKALDVQSPHMLLTQLNTVIRAVDLHRMQMALKVAYFREDELHLSSAAMPPAFIFRAATREVEEMLIPGVPLGALADSSYQVEIHRFERGDSVVLLSDGLPEWLDEKGRPGYELVAQTIAEHGHLAPTQLIAALTNLVDIGDESPPDDVTLVVVKRPA